MAVFELDVESVAELMNVECDVEFDVEMCITFDAECDVEFDLSLAFKCDV